MARETYRDRETEDLPSVTHRMPHPPVLLRVVHLDEPVQPRTQHPLLPSLALRPAQTRNSLLVVTQRLQAVLRPRIHLVLLRSTPTRTRSQQVPHAHDRPSRRNRHRPTLAHDDILDGLPVSTHPDLSSALRVGHARVPKANGPVVAAGKDEGGGGRDESGGADVVGVEGEGAEGGRGREVEEADGGVGRGGEELGAGSGGELGRVDGSAEEVSFELVGELRRRDVLLVGAYCPQDSSAVDIEHLHESSVVSSDAQLAISSNLSAPRDLLEPRDGLDDSVRFGRVDLQAGSGRNDVAMGSGRGEGDVGDGSVGLEEDGRLARD